MSRIAVTGASGRYGRLATAKLIAQGRARDLILITRTPPKLADCAQAGCEVRYGDFDKPATLRFALPDGRGRVMVAAPNRVLHDSLVDGNEAYAPAGSYVLFAGAPGDTLRISEIPSL